MRPSLPFSTSFVACLCLAAAPVAGSYVMSLPTTLLTTRPCLVADHPGGGSLLLWRDEADTLLMRQLDPWGQPVGDPEPFPFADVTGCPLQLEIAADGAAVVLWFDAEGERFRAVLLDAAMQPVSDLPVGLDGTGVIVRQSRPTPLDADLFAPRVEAHPAGGFLFLWDEHTPGDCELDFYPCDEPEPPIFAWTTDVFLQRLDAAGQPVGEPVRVNEWREDAQERIGVVLTPADTVVVTWNSWIGEAYLMEVRARVFDLDLAPLTPELQVNSEEFSRTGQYFEAPAAVAADGSFLLVWDSTGQDYLDDNVWPEAIVGRWYAADGSPEWEERVLNETEPGTQTAGAAAIAGDGTAWVLWTDLGTELGPETPIRLMIRRFARDGTALDGEAEIAMSPFLGRQDRIRPLPEAGVLVLWEEGGALLARTVEPSEIEPPGDGPALITPAISGFRFWVRITSQGGKERWGAREDACIGETLCVSGAVPSRSEVLVRVVGPKPNGYLWPTIVKLSTSQVEVWIEQERTGTVQYYLLEGASPGFDVLPGLFDRGGFPP